MTELVLRSSPSDGVVLLQLNRPEARNALNRALRMALKDEIDAIAKDPGVRVVVITGDDKALAAGADLKAVATATATEMAANDLHHVWTSLAGLEKPLVVAVRGYAMGGGCELAMHGDVIVVGENASLALPEIRVGIMPGAGGVVRLIRLIGRSRAMRMLLTAEAISGRTAFEWGLASDVVPDDEVLDRALSYARTIAAMPAGSAAKIKQVSLKGADLPLPEGLALEREACWGLFGSTDQREGMAAFIEKRKPEFNKG